MTGRELAKRPPAIDVAGRVTLVHPDTGELVPIDAPDEQLADVLDAIRQWESVARAAKALISAELHARMDTNACWTRRAGRYEIKGQSPGGVEWDVDALSDALGNLVCDGLITAEASDAALERVVTLKPRARGLNALLKIDGQVRDAVEACRVEVHKDRRISLKRAA